METIITYLYAVAGAVAIALYAPQIIKYTVHKNKRSGISLLTWGGFTATGIIEVLYGITVVKDPLVITIFAGHLVGSLWILILGVKCINDKILTPNQH